MNIELESPEKKIKQLNLIAFSVLLVAILLYQVTILLQNYYIERETVEFGLSNQERLLSKEIQDDLVSSLTALDYLSRDRYIRKARQNMNMLAMNHNQLLDKSVHFPLLHSEDDITRHVYEKATPYLDKMNDAVFMAVAINEQLNYTTSQQQSLRLAVDSYLQNRQLFSNLIDEGTELSARNAKNYMTQMPKISWLLIVLIFIVMMLNQRLVYRRSVITTKNQFLQLQQKMEFQNALLSSTHEAVITFSTTGIITLFSPSAEKMFGYLKKEVIGKHLCHLMVSSNSSVYCRSCFDSKNFSVCHLMNAKPEKLEIHGLRKNAETFPMLLELDELKTANQHLYIGFIHDLTVEKAAELKLLQAKQEAEDANKAKSEFLSNISHELKTPLNAILGFSQLLESNEIEPLTTEQTESVRHIYKAGKLLLALIGDVLELSKIETGNVNLNIEDVSVNEVILEALCLMDSIAKEHHLNIKTRFDPLAVITIRVDGLRLKQILINLLSNAIKYNSENGLIVLRSKIERNRIKISVKDSGKGIDESKLMQLFQPFNRLGAEKTDVEGTGIGLCIAKNLVERMGGTIGVTNNKDVGCCFWVEFPIVQQKTSVTEHATEASKNLHDEIVHLQDSLTIIGLVKKSQSQTENAVQTEEKTTFH